MAQRIGAGNVDEVGAKGPQVAAHRARHAVGNPIFAPARHRHGRRADQRSEEHTSELQSLMRISYAVFCLKKKNDHRDHPHFCLTSIDSTIQATLADYEAITRVHYSTA